MAGEKLKERVLLKGEAGGGVAAAGAEEKAATVAEAVGDSRAFGRLSRCVLAAERGGEGGGQGSAAGDYCLHGKPFEESCHVEAVLGFLPPPAPRSPFPLKQKGQLPALPALPPLPLPSPPLPSSPLRTLPPLRSPAPSPTASTHDVDVADARGVLRRLKSRSAGKG
ncbi:unnamed protein product [Closterium sp. Naga37s-1]|nr:unnamed protein product [Closterium sp. Naga37s-1]